MPSGNAFSPWIIGPLARTVADCSLAFGILAEPDVRDLFSLPPLGNGELSLDASLAGLRLAWCPRITGAPVEPEVEAAAGEAVRGLEREYGVKVTVQERPLRAPLASLVTIFRLTALAAAGIGSKAEFERVCDRLSPTFVEFIRDGLSLGLSDYWSAQVDTTNFVELEAADYFSSYDLLATPTTTTPAFSKGLALGPDRVAGETIDPYSGWVLTWPFNLTGQPAVSVPCGWTGDGLPIGLQLVGHRHADGLVLRVAAAVEATSVVVGRHPRLAP